MNLKEAIVHEARTSIEEQREDGSMPPGHNGPYFHPETPLRNTGHWLMTWANIWQWTGEDMFRTAAERALRYVLMPMHRPHGRNWVHRNQKGRDRCNGIIGAAWTIEALCTAHRLLGSNQALDVAAEVANLHPFDEARGLWHRLEVDGKILSIDQTFNHQLWFAASVARLVIEGHSEFQWQLATFLTRLDQWFNVDRRGLVRHRIVFDWKDRLFAPGMLPHWLFIRYRALKTQSKPLDARKRDIGYHAFNLHAFALLKGRFTKHLFWKSTVLERALKFARSETHRKETEKNNPYAYTYNPVGFEMAFATRILTSASLAEADGWAERQWALLSDGGRHRYGKSAHDPHTARARIYEAVEYYTP